MNAIEINNLSFQYARNEPIIKNINLHIPEGCIYGFLGPNGAGKTTTLRLILNLLQAQAGSIRVLGTEVQQGRSQYLAQVGSLLEHSSLYGHLSAAKNLSIWAHYHGLPSSRVEEVLKLVGLRDVAKKKTAQFSTGMKQRLGLAMALLNDPAILLLDEPTNGLDPLGIADLRGILKRLRDEGKTILFSSHILTEVEKVVDKIGMIRKGEMVYEGSLKGMHQMMLKNTKILLKVDQPQGVIDLFSSEYLFEQEGNYLAFSVENEFEISAMARKIITAGMAIYEIKKEEIDLESIFLKMAVGAPVK